ncbi:DUF5076 domain-containing protein [Brevundimonas sp.]|uniref:DUF5076 domain-containing protein n=1 Tax=Brevundimonas sp. TaxID=1871086 RepID=UPI001AD1790F|nr:DUF5076 domain-containing protein [Brevundimonas sp.]MBN9464400.1 DUF5076 domain-containing protein [Brevundimonas sp.]
MSLMDRALQIPEGIDPQAEDNTELVRIWWQGNGPTMVIRPALRDPQLVGAMLAELAFHFSKAFEERNGLPQPEAMAIIQKSWLEAHARAVAQMGGVQ